MLLLDGRKDVFRVKRRLEHHRCAHEVEIHLLDLAAEMKERHHDERLVGGGNPALMGEHSGRFDHCGVADHDALWSPGRAAGVHEVSKVASDRRHRRRLGACCVDQVFVAQCVGSFGIDRYSHTDACNLGRKHARARGKIPGMDQDARRAIPADRAKLGLRKPAVEIDGNKTRNFAGTKDLDVLAAVACKQRDPFLFSHSLCDERIGQAEHPGGLLGECELPAFKRQRGLPCV